MRCASLFRNLLVNNGGRAKCGLFSFAYRAPIDSVLCFAILSSMTIDWTDIYKKYAGKWVAIDPDDQTKVIAADVDARKAYEASIKFGKEGILHRVPEEVVDFVGNHEI